MSNNNEEIQRAARALREQERYQEQLQSTNTAGETTYGEKWDKALDKLATFGQVDPADFSAILNTDDPAKVLFELGTNPAEYQRLMALPPARRQIEIVKIAVKEAPKVAPPPVAPKADLQSEKTSDAEWYAARRKQKEEWFKQQREAGRR